MKSKYNNTAKFKFSALSQDGMDGMDGMDEDYFSDVHGSGDEKSWRSPWCWAGAGLCCLCIVVLPLFL